MTYSVSGIANSGKRAREPEALMSHQQQRRIASLVAISLHLDQEGRLNFRQSRRFESMTDEERSIVEIYLEEAKRGVVHEKWMKTCYSVNLSELLPIAEKSPPLSDVEDNYSLEAVRILLTTKNVNNLRNLRDLFQKNPFVFTPQFLEALQVNQDAYVTLEGEEFTVRDVFLSMRAFYQIPLRKFLVLVVDEVDREQKRAIIERKRAVVERRLAIIEQKQVVAERRQALAKEMELFIGQTQVQMIAEQARAIAELAQPLAEQEQMLIEQEPLVAEEELAIVTQEEMILKQEQEFAEQTLIQQEQLMFAIKNIVIFPRYQLRQKMFHIIADILIQNGTVAPFIELIEPFPAKLHQQFLQAAILEARRSGNWTIVAGMIERHLWKIPSHCDNSLIHRLKISPEAPEEVQQLFVRKQVPNIEIVNCRFLSPEHRDGDSVRVLEIASGKEQTISQSRFSPHEEEELGSALDDFEFDPDIDLEDLIEI